jgi:hypothetical protein
VHFGLQQRFCLSKLCLQPPAVLTQQGLHLAAAKQAAAAASTLTEVFASCNAS